MFVADQATKDKLNSVECSGKDCTNKPTYAIFIIESLSQSNLLGVACDEHKNDLGDLFSQLGVQATISTEPLEQFKRRIS